MDQMKENIARLKNHIEEAHMSEKLLRSQLIEKKEACCRLESKVTDIKRKIGKSKESVKFMNNSTILDDILNN
jgi:septal ring factor EnvC (AmiA/AmiB activator)